MSAVLLRFAWRQMRSRPGRALLTLMSIVIGTAAIAAVDMTAVSTRSAYKKMFSLVNGAASLIVSGAAQSSFDAELVARLEAIAGVKTAVPVIQRGAVLFAGEQGSSTRVRINVLGVDPVRDGEMRDHEVTEGRFVESGEETILDEGFARLLNIKVGDEVRLLAGGGGILGGGRYHLTVVGLMKATSQARTSTGGVLFVPLDQAQRMFMREKPQIDQVQIVLEDEKLEAAVLPRIEAMLPEGLSARRPSGKTKVLEQTLHSTEQGLDVSVKFSALLAAFIVFNTFLMNVSERRKQFAIMRAVGTTGKQILHLLLTESAVLGILGSFLGVAIGWGGAILLTRSIGNSLQVEIPEAQLTPYIAGKAIGFGLLVSLIGSIIPAWLASKLTPLEALRATGASAAKHPGRASMIIGSLIVAGGLIFLYTALSERVPVDLGVEAAVIVLLGAVFLAHAFLAPAVKFTGDLLRPWFGVTATLAQRQLIRNRTRSTLTSGVLFVAAATGIGMSYAILDAVQDIRDWYGKAIVGDFYVRTTLPDFATGESPPLPDEVGPEIRAIPGIASADAAKFIKTKAAEVECLIATREYPTERDMTFDLIEGDETTLYKRLKEGEAAVSTVLASQSKLKLGDLMSLETPEGRRHVRVGAIVNEYAFGGLTAWMDRAPAQKLLGFTGVDAYVIRVEDHTKSAQVQADLEAMCRNHGVLLHSFRQIRETVDGIISATDGCLWALVVLEFVVASFGVVNTLTMNVLEQTRELGMLRIVAMTRDQVRKTIVAQALILGLIGVVPGIFAGLAIAYLMNLAAMASINHPIELGSHPDMVIGTFFGAMALVLIAAFIPAYRASRIDVLKALQYE